MVLVSFGPLGGGAAMPWGLAFPEPPPRLARPSLHLLCGPLRGTSLSSCTRSPQGLSEARGPQPRSGCTACPSAPLSMLRAPHVLPQLGDCSSAALITRQFRDTRSASARGAGPLEGSSECVGGGREEAAVPAGSSLPSLVSADTGSF